jgi:tetratricopeptide (TPR) repeat protein
MASKARVDLAEALVRAGAPAEARAHLQQAIAAGGDTGARALLLLAEVEAAAGNRAGALAAYDRALREHPSSERSLLSHAGELESAGHADTARVLLERIVQASAGEVAAEASYRIARILSAQRQDAAAVEWYMTAAYVGAGSQWERPSLLAASQAFIALNRRDEALIAHRKAMGNPATATPRDASPTPPAASPPLAEPRAPRDGTPDASLQAADALQRAGEHEAALDMYLTVAHRTRGAPTASRALLGAIRCLVAIDDRPAAEAIYRRLLESGDTDPALLADARKTIRGAGR